VPYPQGKRFRKLSIHARIESLSKDFGNVAKVGVAQRKDFEEYSS